MKCKRCLMPVEEIYKDGLCQRCIDFKSGEAHGRYVVNLRLEEARAHVEALAYNNPGLLSRKARIEAARKWLEAQDGNR